MENLIKSYKVKAQLEFGKITRSIENLKEIFNSTDWTDERLMIEAANEIWRLEKRLKDVLEIHKIILDSTKKD